MSESAPSPAAPERIAIVSDIHGNLTGFRAVLADIASRGVTRIINLGDVVGKGPRGSACVALSRERCEVTVRGNWDDFLPLDDTAHGDEAMRWWHCELGTEDRRWLRALPLAHHLTLSGRIIRLIHASADSVYTRVRRRHSDEEFEAMFATTPLTGPGPAPSVVCYGDIHDSYLESHDDRTLVNVGSVGDPLDIPAASYVILEGVPGGAMTDPFGVQFVRVTYDVEVEIAAAAELRMPELDAYAVELRTAVFRGLHVERGLR